MHTTSSQRPHDVPTAYLQRPWRSYSAHEVAAACFRRAHDEHQRTYSVLKALIAFKFLENIVTYLDCSKQFVISFNSCSKSRRTCNMFSKTDIQNSVHRIVFISVCFCWGLIILYSNYKQWSICKRCPFNLNEDFHKNKYIIKHLLFLWIFVLLSKCIANTASKYRIYTASLPRARDAPTTRPGALARCANAKMRSCLCACMFKLNAAAWHSRRWHSVYIALLATAQRTTAICNF